MKALSFLLFAAYLFILLWLVLFKFSYEPFAVINTLQMRSINLVPFARTRNSEIISNLLAFIPFGVMLGVNFRQAAFRYKIGVIFAFSLAAEIIQYVLAIGVSDITDIMMNTLGGLIGLAAYELIGKYTNHRYLDVSILVLGTLALLGVLYLRIFVFIVKY
jgi:glycopeptide antibiotics resistance protein